MDSRDKQNLLIGSFIAEAARIEASREDILAVIEELEKIAASANAMAVALSTEMRTFAKAVCR